MRLREERIGDFIMAAREELTGLWEKLYLSEEQRRQFEPAFNGRLRYINHCVNLTFS